MFELYTIRRKIAGLLLLAGLFSTACHKKDDPKPANPDNPSVISAKTGTLMFHLHTYLDDVEADGYNIAYTTTEGRKISLSTAQLYISKIELIKKDGSVYPIPDTVLLKVFDQSTYEAGNVPIGDYKAIRFKVGLDPAINTKTPSTNANDVLNTSNMWFGNSAQPDGYVFVNLQGKIDTTTNADGTIAKMQPFSYRIGTNANYKQVSMPDHGFTITEGLTHYQHIIIDYNKLFRGIKLNNSSNLNMVTPADNASALGTKLAGNIPSMFSFEE